MLYLGPEIIAPVLSAVAAIGGVLLMFWRRVVGGARAVMRLLTGKSGRKATADQDSPV